MVSSYGWHSLEIDLTHLHLSHRKILTWVTITAIPSTGYLMSANCLPWIDLLNQDYRLRERL